MATTKSSDRGLTLYSRGESERPEATQNLADELESRDSIVKQRSEDPGDGNPEDGDLAQGTGMLYISDGSAGVTGSDGDLVVAQNQGGTVQTAIVQSRSGMS